MTTVTAIAGRLANVCVPVPPAGKGVCERCHNHPKSDFRLCYSCWEVESQVSSPCHLVVPVSLYEVPSQLHQYLRDYKDSQDARVRHDFSAKVVCLLCYFLSQHKHCIEAAAGGGLNIITSVPSTSGRQGEHPLVTALRRVPRFFQDYEPLVVAGSVPLDHKKASDDGFRPARPLAGERVLLIDDTFTSGARVQSAASALNNGGATVVAIVPIGRVIDPSFGDVAEWWKELKRQPFSFDTCCIEEEPPF